MAQKTSINDETVKIIETALTELESNPKYGISTESVKQGKSDIYNTFVQAVIETQSPDKVQAFKDEINAREEKLVKVFSDDQHVAMMILDIDVSIAVNLFLPSRGGFDWSKTDWINRKAEYDAFYTFVERTISKYFNYRIFHQRPERVS